MKTFVLFCLCALPWLGARLYLQESGIRHVPQLYKRLLELATRTAREQADRRQPGDVEGQPDGRGKESVGNVHRIPR